MATETCRHGTDAPQEMLAGLPESQGGLGRHRCAACAYDLGTREFSGSVASRGTMVRCSHGRFAPEAILQTLRENQGGTGRHKCVVCAYQAGRANGRGLPNETAWSPKQGLEEGVLNDAVPPRRPAREPPSDLGSVDHERNKRIGDMGESLVLDAEISSLLHAGRADLANRVTHVAVEEGDAAGYDIRSYYPDGRVKYIEVKTTTGPSETPFFLTENERSFASQHPEQYHLYRLYELKETPLSATRYVVRGRPEDHFTLTPNQYRVIPSYEDNGQ